MGFNKIAKGRYGHFVYNKNDIYVGRAVEKYGEYSENEVKLFKKLIKPNYFVVDIGANIGTHTLVFSKLAKSVVAFEPQRIVFQTLCANMAINSVTNVDCQQTVVGDSEGYANLPMLDYNREGNFGGVRVNGSCGGERVRQTRLDNYLYGIDRVDFIKIDVEGMEINVLNGARAIIKRHKPMLYVENDNLDKSEQLINLIKSFGYRPYWHTPYLFNEHNWAGDSENIYPRIVSVNLLCTPTNFGEVRGLIEAVDAKDHPFRRGSGTH